MDYPVIPHSIPTKLDPAGTKFSIWVYRMEVLLRGGSLWSAFDTKSPSGVSPVVDAAAQMQIIHNLPDDLLWIVRGHKTAAEQWTALHEHFQPHSSYKGLYALRRFQGVRLADGGDIVAHVNHMGTLWSEVAASGVCSESNPDTYFSVMLLKSLPSSWGEFVAQWMPEVARKRLPSASLVARLLEMNFVRQARKGREPQGSPIATP
jgi:hypothetical protein